MLKYGKVRKRLTEGVEGLPRKGYQTICVTDEVYRYIQAKAAETNCSIPEYIKHLIENETQKEGKQ